MEIKKGYIKNKLGEKHIIVPTGEAARGASSNLMIKLNDSAAEIWDQLAAGRSVDEVTEHILEVYEVEQTKARRDVEAVLEKMKEIEAFK